MAPVFEIVSFSNDYWLRKYQNCDKILLSDLKPSLFNSTEQLQAYSVVPGHHTYILR
jgi:hypothetical protein